MAFQPIVDLEDGSIYAYEALVRALDGRGGAAAVLSQVTDENRYAFDQACRRKAIELASALGMQSLLSVNFLPNAAYSPGSSLERTFETAALCDFPPHHIILEVSETEPARDPARLKAIFADYKRQGMLTAIDDFGAGHSGLNTLAEFQPDIVKIDMDLTRNVHKDRVRRAITRAIVTMCRDLGISVIAEGVENVHEVLTLREMGIRLYQGYLFARPEVGLLPGVSAELLADLGGKLDQHLLEFGAANLRA